MRRVSMARVFVAQFILFFITLINIGTSKASGETFLQLYLKEWCYPRQYVLDGGGENYSNAKIQIVIVMNFRSFYTKDAITKTMSQSNE